LDDNGVDGLQEDGNDTITAMMNYTMNDDSNITETTSDHSIHITKLNVTEDNKNITKPVGNMRNNTYSDNKKSNDETIPKTNVANMINMTTMINMTMANNTDYDEEIEITATNKVNKTLTHNEQPPINNSIPIMNNPNNTVNGTNTTSENPLPQDFNNHIEDIKTNTSIPSDQTPVSNKTVATFNETDFDIIGDTPQNLTLKHQKVKSRKSKKKIASLTKKEENETNIIPKEAFKELKQFRHYTTPANYSKNVSFNEKLEEYENLEINIYKRIINITLSLIVIGLLMGVLLGLILVMYLNTRNK
jgi:hypothetical protein